jgi:hypothetical protein
MMIRMGFWSRERVQHGDLLVIVIEYCVENKNNIVKAQT